MNLKNPISLAITMGGAHNSKAWYIPDVRIEPVMNERFMGSVEKGGFVNFRNITFNPHGNGTHTECVGHVAKQVYSVLDCFENYFFSAQLISVTPEKTNGDNIITKACLLPFAEKIKGKEALIIRTLPNTEQKLNIDYSNTNPTYFSLDAMQLIVDLNITHLLVDVPSVDREEDGGALAAHKLFWDYPNIPFSKKTITELIFVPNQVVDGEYLLNLQLAPFVNDATPSNPVIYKI
jgi:arylformamidase